MTASTSKTLRSICSISLSAAKLHFCIHSATLRPSDLISGFESPGSDATAYLTRYLRLTFGQSDLPDGLLSDSTTYPAAYLGPKPRGARGAAPDRGAVSAPRRGHAPSRTSS